MLFGEASIASEGQRTSTFLDQNQKSNTNDFNTDDKCTNDEKKKTPVWVDEDDEDTFVDISKVNRLKKIRASEEEKNISGNDFTRRLQEQYYEFNY